MILLGKKKRDIDKAAIGNRSKFCILGYFKMLSI